MEILTIKYWDDPVLSKICDKIEDNEFGPKFEEFGWQLIATMTAKNGIGLAAPQVGVTKRMFAMTFPGLLSSAIVVCNPVIELSGKTVPGREGCLSLPGVYEQVYRAEIVTMQYSDPLGKQHEVVLATPIDARIAQHETDHLDGIMFFDYKDKREQYATEAHPKPWGARMSKQLSKHVMREWEKRKGNNG